MTQLTQIQYGWSHLLWLTILLVLLYLLLLFFRKIMSNLVFIGGWRSTIGIIVDRATTLYEPIALLIIFSLFVAINPLLHGIFTGLFVLLSIAHIRNYVHGKMIKTNRAIELGRKITVADQEGIITKMGRLGIQVRSDEGLHFIPYGNIISSGFILSSGVNIGGYYKLDITLPKEVEFRQSVQELTDLLISSPYIDGDYKPEISRSISSEHKTKVKLLVREEGHVHDLISLLEENGYQSEITKS